MYSLEAVPHRPQADSFQIGASLSGVKQAIARHWLVVVVTTLLTTGLAGAYVWIWPPVYEAKVMVAAASEKDASRQSFYSGWDVFRQDILANEGEMLTSAPVIRETIRRLNLKYDDVYHPFLSYLTHLWAHSAIGNAYRKVKHWIFPRKPNPFAPTPEKAEAFQMFSDFRKGVSIERLNESSMGVLAVKGSTQRVAEIANTMAKVYLDLRREEQIREASQAQASLQQEVDRIHGNLRRLDNEIAEFRKANSLLLQNENDKVRIGNYENRRQAVGDLKAAIASEESELSSVERGLAREGALLNSRRVFKYTAAKDRLAKLEEQLGQTRQEFAPESRDVRDLEEQIRIAMAAVDAGKPSVVVRNAAGVSKSYEVLLARKLALESQIAGDRASLATKTAELERERILLENLPRKLEMNHEYERREAVMEGELRTLYEKLSMATVSLAAARSAPPALRVVEYALPPERPVWPLTKYLIVAAAAFGMLLGTMVALLLDLSFVRVTVERLLERGQAYPLFAIVGRDDRFLRQLYGGQPALLAPDAGASRS